MGGRILCLALPLVGLALSVWLGGAKGTERAQPAPALTRPAAPRGPSPEAESAFASLRSALKRAQKARATDRAALIERVFARSGAFLDAYSAEASQYQLRYAAGYWLQLAEERGQLDAMQERVNSLRALPALPADLATKLTFLQGRLDARVGHEAPAWSAPRLDGSGPLASSELSGLVLLNFWATWNPHCRDLIQQRLAPLSRDREGTLTLVHVGVPTNGETTSRQRAYFEGASCLGEKVFDEDGSLAKSFGADGTPLLCLIGADGSILARGPGWDVVSEIEGILARR